MKFKLAALALALAFGGLVSSPASATEEATPPYVRPDVQAHLEWAKANPRPPLNAETIAALRTPEGKAAVLGSDKPLGELAVDKTLTMPGPGGRIALRLFDAKAERAAGPVLVFYHGGGFAVGGIATHAPLAAEMARQLDVPVVSVEYRLAPENKWPAAPDDAEAAARWIASAGKELGREATGLILSGDSAGGNLTLVTALALRDKPAAAPVKLAIALYPLTDGSRLYPSMIEFAAGYGLSRNGLAAYFQLYSADSNSVRYSVLLADHKGFPPTMLATAALDPLRDEGRAFAAKLAEAGVPVSFYEAAGNVHGFATNRKSIPSAQGDLDQILAMARTMLAAGK